MPPGERGPEGEEWSPHILSLSHAGSLLQPPGRGMANSAAYDPSVSQSVFTITEKAPTRAFFWLKAPARAFTFKTLLRHYANLMKTVLSRTILLKTKCIASF